jgi:4-amino-4-deoxy-L-arabinose transferase-like glycosyltransferase
MSRYLMEKKAAAKELFSSTREVVTAIAALGVLLRLVWCLMLPNSFFWGDEGEYSAIAIHLVDHGFYSMDGVHPTAYRAPGQVMLMAVLYAFNGPNPPAVRICQSILWGAAIWLAFRLALELGASRRAAVWTAAAVALYPVYIYAAGALFPMTLFTLALLAGTFALVRAYNVGGARVAAVGGAMLGIGTLTIPYLLPAVLLTPFWLGRQRRREALAAVIVALLVVAPWPLRNWAEIGKPVMGTQQWLNVWYGNNPDATAVTGSSLFLRDKATSDRYILAQRRDELAADQIMRNEALRYIRAHPFHTAWLWWCKAVNLYRPWPETLTVNAHSGWPAKLLGGLSFGPVFLLGWLGWWRGVLDRRRAGIILIYFAVFTAVAAVTISKVRFRMPLDVYLMIFAAALADRWWPVKHEALVTRTRRRA